MMNKRRLRIVKFAAIGATVMVLAWVVAGKCN